MKTVMAKLFTISTILLILLLLAIMLGFGMYQYSIIFSLLLLIPIFLIFLVSSFNTQQDLFFWLLFLIIMFSAIVASVTRQSLAYVPTGIILALAPIIIINIFKQIKFSIKTLLLLSTVALFFFLSFLSSVLGRSEFLPAVYSGIIALKPYLLIGFGFSLIWSNKSEKWFEYFLKYAWLPLLIVALIQWFSPELFRYINPDAELSYEKNPFFQGFSRATSLFPQSSILASFSCIFLLFLFTDFILRKKIILLFISFIYFILLMMTGQRQELIVTLAIIPLILILIHWKVSFKTLLFISLGVVLMSGLLIYLVSPEAIADELKYWDISSGASTNHMSARAILYLDSFRLANQYWPVGSGLGTFGSVGAVKFDQSLFIELGYTKFWWFTKKSYLMDSYWSKYIAESGWLGFLSQLIFYTYILKIIVGWVADARVRENISTFRYSLFAFIGLFYVFLTSPTAFNLAEPHGGLVPLMFIGISWQKIKQLKWQSNTVIKRQY